MDMKKYKMILDGIDDFSKREVLSGSEKSIFLKRIKDTFMEDSNGYNDQRVSLLLQAFLMTDEIYLSSHNKNKDYSKCILITFKRNEIKVIVRISLVSQTVPIRADRFYNNYRKGVYMLGCDKEVKLAIYNLLIGK